MNVVKVYLKEVHEEKPYTDEWFKQFSDIIAKQIEGEK